MQNTFDEQERQEADDTIYVSEFKKDVGTRWDRGLLTAPQWAPPTP
jgi:hypothetical protein